MIIEIGIKKNNHPVDISRHFTNTSYGDHFYSNDELNRKSGSICVKEESVIR